MFTASAAHISRKMWTTNVFQIAYICCYTLNAVLFKAVLLLCGVLISTRVVLSTAVFICAQNYCCFVHAKDRKDAILSHLNTCTLTQFCHLCYFTFMAFVRVISASCSTLIFLCAFLDASQGETALNIINRAVQRRRMPCGTRNMCSTWPDLNKFYTMQLNFKVLCAFGP